MSEEEKAAQDSKSALEVQDVEKEDSKETESKAKDTMDDEKPSPKEKETTQATSERSSCGKCLGCGIIFLAITLIFMVIVGFLGYLLFKDYVFEDEIGSSGNTEGFEEFLEDIDLEVDGLEFEEMCFTCDPLTYEGEVSKTVIITDKDAASWFQTVNSGLYGMRNTRMALSDDGVAIQTTISYTGQEFPIYLFGDIERVDDKSVDIDLKTLKVASFTIPEQYIVMAETFLEDMANTKIAEVDGLNIYKLEITDGEAIFEGTVPEKVTSK